MCDSHGGKHEAIVVKDDADHLWNNGDVRPQGIEVDAVREQAIVEDLALGLNTAKQRERQGRFSGSSSPDLTLYKYKKRINLAWDAPIPTRSPALTSKDTFWRTSGPSCKTGQASEATSTG